MLDNLKIEDSEKVHESNISRLIEAYGTEKEQEIRRLYEQNRTELESLATIKDHIPFFTYQQTERNLQENYGKPSKKEKNHQKNPTIDTPKKRKGLLGFIGFS